MKLKLDAATLVTVGFILVMALTLFALLADPKAKGGMEAPRDATANSPLGNQQPVAPAVAPATAVARPTPSAPVTPLPPVAVT
ncbi:MAG: hypothetical protein HQM01_08675, partial [Magnetococcales bacterium]|nr:hypothetical protein [Magnetococcales bacterium]